jgi:hypothetical protein
MTSRIEPVMVGSLRCALTLLHWRKRCPNVSPDHVALAMWSALVNLNRRASSPLTAVYPLVTAVRLDAGDGPRVTEAFANPR